MARERQNIFIPAAVEEQVSRKKKKQVPLHSARSCCSCFTGRAQSESDKQRVQCWPVQVAACEACCGLSTPLCMCVCVSLDSVGADVSSFHAHAAHSV